jgi:hypothetical protein
MDETMSHLRRVVIRDQADRDASLASAPLPRRARRDWADIIATLTTHPEQSERFMRVLGQIDGEATRNARNEFGGPLGKLASLTEPPMIA